LVSDTFGQVAGDRDGTTTGLSLYLQLENAVALEIRRQISMHCMSNAKLFKDHYEAQEMSEKKETEGAAKWESLLASAMERAGSEAAVEGEMLDSLEVYFASGAWARNLEQRHQTASQDRAVPQFLKN